ncbi:MAG: hypothetical protein WBA74_01025, partial [Cyclobacteriaceae bacterium]
VPGCNNVVEHEVNGLLCQLKDMKSLRDSMRKMALSDQETIDRYSVSSRQKAIKEFDEKLVINSYLEKIEEITNVRIKKNNTKEEVTV